MKQEILREKRTEKKLTLRALAALSGLSFTYLSQMENCKKSNPTLEALEKIAKALEIDVKELI